MTITEPIKESLKNIDFESYNLILTNYAQPRIYKYYTDYQPNETGHFYIKAFEITSNDRLSGDRMKEKSKAIVDNLNPQNGMESLLSTKEIGVTNVEVELNFGINLQADKNTK